MNVFANLPKIAHYNGKDYFFRSWINEWKELCLGYKAIGDDEVMWTHTVVFWQTVRIPKIENEMPENDFIKHLRAYHNLDECIAAVNNKIKELGLRGE